MLQIFYTHYEYQISEPLLGNLCQRLPSTIVDTCKGLIRWENKQACILGRLLLLHGLKNYGYEDGCLNQLKVKPHGKPHIDADIHFNLSHSGNFVVAAFSKTVEVGIDIEKIKKIEVDNFKNIFSEKEKLLLEKSMDPQMDFFKIWTTKESVVKAEGKGLSIPLTSIDASCRNEVHCNDKIWYVQQIPLHPLYICTLASEKMMDNTITKVEFSASSI